MCGLWPPWLRPCWCKRSSPLCVFRTGQRAVRLECLGLCPAGHSLGRQCATLCTSDCPTPGYKRFLINGEKYKLGASPHDGNNFHTLRQCCSAVSWPCRADVAAMRLSLQSAFPARGHSEVLATSYLTLDVPWRAMLQSMLDVGQDVVDATFCLVLGRAPWHTPWEPER